MITSSTVGFGDICPATRGARLFTMFAASLGLGIVSLFINEFTALQDERKAYLLKSRQAVTPPLSSVSHDQSLQLRESLISRSDIIIACVRVRVYSAAAAAGGVRLEADR